MNDLTINGQADADSIRSRILTVRGVQVMLDRDLAELYGVPTRRLNEQVKRNIRRFPDSFMFQLTKEELEDWRSQIATSNNASSPERPQIVTLNKRQMYDAFEQMKKFVRMVRLSTISARSASSSRRSTSRTSPTFWRRSDNFAQSRLIFAILSAADRKKFMR